MIVLCQTPKMVLMEAILLKRMEDIFRMLQGFNVPVSGAQTDLKINFVLVFRGRKGRTTFFSEVLGFKRVGKVTVLEMCWELLHKKRAGGKQIMYAKRFV